MRPKVVIILLVIAFIISVIAGCSSPEEPGQIANPASEFCVDQGGTLDIRKDESGGEVGYCQFDDGSECEEWAFFRGECSQGEFPASNQIANPAAVYCSEQDGEYEVREHEDGGQYGVCSFNDGSECDAWAFFRGECMPGDN